MRVQGLIQKFCLGGGGGRLVVGNENMLNKIMNTLLQVAIEGPDLSCTVKPRLSQQLCSQNSVLCSGK